MSIRLHVIYLRHRIIIESCYLSPETSYEILVNIGKFFNKMLADFMLLKFAIKVCIALIFLTFIEYSLTVACNLVKLEKYFPW